MKKYDAKVTLIQIHSITIEADSWEEAQDKADNMNLIDLELDEPVYQELNYISVEGEI